MAWYIKCTDANCDKVTVAWQIVDLINNHLDNQGWIKCACGRDGYIEKSFDTQEGDVWNPFLRGIIPLGKEGNTYQPFVFLVSYEANSPVKDVWFSYYKDLREEGGRLKLGYGPGGPPVLDKADLIELMKKLIEINCLSTGQLHELIRLAENRTSGI